MEGSRPVGEGRHLGHTPRAPASQLVGTRHPPAGLKTSLALLAVLLATRQLLTVLWCACWGCVCAIIASRHRTFAYLVACRCNRRAR